MENELLSRQYFIKPPVNNGKSLVGGIGLPSMEECCSYMVVGTDELEADELEADELTEPRKASSSSRTSRTFVSLYG